MNNPQIKILPQINPLSPSKMNKKAYEFSFAWIFAIIIGAVIIFVAIYASTQLIDTSRFLGDTETAKQIGTLLSPLETTLESGKTSIIRTQAETRIFNECVSSRGTFGSQDISVSTSSGVGDVWPKTPGATSSFHNKYMFSSEIVQGEEFYAFSTPFKFPFTAFGFYIFHISKQLISIFWNHDGNNKNITFSILSGFINVTIELFRIHIENCNKFNVGQLYTLREVEVSQMRRWNPNTKI